METKASTSPATEPSAIPSKARSRVRFVLSLFIAFHLIAIFFGPNSESLLGYALRGPLEPYLRITGFGVPWKFFSPEPGPLVFIEWELIAENGESFEQGRWPDPREEFFWVERRNRRIKIVTVIGLDDKKTDSVMTPYLCRDPRVHSVRLFRAVIASPRLKEVQDGARSVGDEGPKIASSRQTVSHTFCSSLKQGEAG